MNALTRNCKKLAIALTEAARKHFITQTGKKSNTAFKNFIGLGDDGSEGQGSTYGSED